MRKILAETGKKYASRLPRRGRIRKVTFDDEVTGRTLHTLLDDENGCEVPFVRDYIRNRARQSAKNSQNTLDSIGQDLKVFFEYFYAAIHLYESLSPLQTPISDVLSAYPQYLGARVTTSKFAQAVAAQTGVTGYSKASVRRMLSTVNGFLLDSAAYHASLVNLSAAGLLDQSVAKDTIHNILLDKRSLTQRESRILYEKSWLSGCISGGAKITNSSYFTLPTALRAEGSRVNKAFPLTRVVDLLNAAQTARDKCLWSLMLGTGIRTHEALQVLLDDIDPRRESVAAINPNNRPHEYNNLPVEWRKRLTWKQREDGELHFIEPFKSYFFASLEDYLRHERPRKSMTHHFLFVSLSNNALGRPWYLGDASSHNGPIKKAQSLMKMSGIDFDRDYTLHSLRHWFAVFMLNYFKNGNHYGLDENIVRNIMSHQSVETTRLYAVRDRMIIDSMIESFNTAMKSRNLSIDSFITSARSRIGVRRD